MCRAKVERVFVPTFILERAAVGGGGPAGVAAGHLAHAVRGALGGRREDDHGLLVMVLAHGAHEAVLRGAVRVLRGVVRVGVGVGVLVAHGRGRYGA